MAGAPVAPIEPGRITGLVLAGGRGSRLGGVDKGLHRHLGRPLALHALRRLAPQVGSVAVSANRHLDEYEAMGAPVWTDTLAERPGPLAGVLAGLTRCTTPYLATVPCDCPHFPLDLVQRLAAAFADSHVEIAMAATPGAESARAEPVFALMRSDLRASLEAFLGRGERKVERWAEQHRCALVVFADAGAFFNVNTPADLQALRAER